MLLKLAVAAVATAGCWLRCLSWLLQSCGCRLRLSVLLTPSRSRVLLVPLKNLQQQQQQQQQQYTTY
jgi:hypothetical protein